MVAVLAVALLICGASVLAGYGLLRALGESRPSPVAGAIGFAALTTLAPILIRLPGRAATAAVIVGIALIALAVWTLRGRRGEPAPPAPSASTALPAIAAVAAVLAAASLPFLFNEEVGILGEGIYTNDQAAQLYWTDWLQNGFGPEPTAVGFGYPTGPQSLTAIAAEASGTELDDAFNGLLLAIPALAALAALAALTDLRPVARTVAASLVGLPYLGVSFLAQSAFKESAMALFVLAFAVVLQTAAFASGSPRQGLGRAAAIGSLLILTAASVFTYSLPGPLWFALTLIAWAVLERIVAGRSPRLGRLGATLTRRRGTVVAVVVLAIAVVALGAGQASSFISKIGNVQGSVGRLSSPVSPGEALGIWPEGNFQMVRGEVTGAIPASALGLLAVAAGALIALRRRQLALLAALGAAVVVYVGARLFASIYVDAKALAVMAPLAMLVALGMLLAPAPRWGSGAGSTLRRALSIVVAIAAGISTMLALRAAPVGLGDRGAELESLAKRVDGSSVVFLGVDRFAGYWLRGTLAESPGGYVPAEVRARPEKVWQQGLAMDLDTLAPRKLDRFDYAITTNAAFQSSPPPNLRRVTATPSYVLWRRVGQTPPQRVLDEGGDPGRVLDCGRRSVKGSHATVLSDPVKRKPELWSEPVPFEAPGAATQTLRLGPGPWLLSLQYQSQVPLTVEAAGASASLPPSLQGMYLTHQGQGSFWAAGEVEVRHGPVKVTVEAAEPSGLQRALGVERRVWLGGLAATRAGPPTRTSLHGACGRYVDHYVARADVNAGD